MTIEIINDFVNKVKEIVGHHQGYEFYGDFYPTEQGIIHLSSFFRYNFEVVALFRYKYISEIKKEDFWNAVPPQNIPLQYYVFTNGLTHLVYTPKKKKVLETEDVSELLDMLIKENGNKKMVQQYSKIITTIEQSVTDFFNTSSLQNHPLGKKEKSIKSFFTKANLKKNLIYNGIENYFHFSQDIRDLNNFENSFFKTLIDTLDSNQDVYRYTTLDTVFATVNNASIRMNGIVGMNDISEIEYLESYLDDKFDIYSNSESLNEINKKFILCASVLQDDLLEWRLYGDDSKGACLVFSISESKIPGIQIRKVNYGVRDKNLKNSHPELDLLKKIIDDVKTKCGETLKFRTLTIWKHFFKSFEYTSEQEVRLLTILSSNNNIKGEKISGDNAHNIQKQWCLTASHKILTPFITLPLADNAFPMQLKKIILGSKCPEKIINQKQFSQLLSAKNIHASVEISRVTNYR